MIEQKLHSREKTNAENDVFNKTKHKSKTDSIGEDTGSFEIVLMSATQLIQARPSRHPE